MKTHFLLFVVSVLLATPLQGAEPSKDNIAKLVSPVIAERRAGEAWLAAQGADAISELIEQVEKGEPIRQAEAIATLLLLVSPWQRGIETGHRHHGQIELFRPSRPTGRPVDHPNAAQLRRVLLATLTNALQKIQRDPPTDGDYADFSQFSHLISACSTSLTEVADDRTALAIRGLLKRESDPRLGIELMYALETIYGLPAHFQMGGLCGVGLTPEIRLAHQKQQAAAFTKAKQELLDWLDKHAQQPPAERIDAAISVWAERYATTPLYYVSRGNNSPVLVLARLGEPGVDRLRKQQARETTLLGRAFFEVPVATITGKVDDKLIRELIDAKHLADPNLHKIACEIIALANTQAYQKELTAMLRDPRYSSHEVAHAIAIVHRHDAIPLLRKQPESNFIAHCAVKELESWAK